MALLTHIITHHRWILCVFVLLPMSVLFDLFIYIRTLWAALLKRLNPSVRNQRVAAVQAQVRAWAEGPRTSPMVTARPGWQTMSLRVGKYKTTHTAIDLSAFTNILGVNEATNTISVEPLVTIGQLSAFLAARNLTLPVVPELDDLTIGGMMAGCGVESSSHKYGLFQHNCVSMDIVVGDGSVVHVSRTENSDLFHAFPWSHGTLGFLLSVELRTIKSAPWVRLVYFPVSDRSEAVQLIQREAQRAHPATEGSENAKDALPTDGNSTPCADFIESLAYGPNNFVVMLGYFAQSVPQGGRINHLGRWWKPWFYKHASSSTQASKGHVEYVPLRDYYHRHTRSLFWELSDIIPFGNNPLFRILMGWAMPPKPSLLKLTQTEEIRVLYEKFHVVQDMCVPIKVLGESLQVFDTQFLVYPLWLCPMAIPSNTGAGSLGIVESRTGSKDDCMYIDVGAYGVPGAPNYDAERCHRKVEEYVRKVGGFQLLYADCYQTRSEFEAMFDHTLYRQVRQKYPHGTLAFPEIYDKVSRTARH